MPVKSLKSIPIFVWIPPIFTPIYKVTIYNVATAVTTDVTDIIYDGEYTDGITDTIGSFRFKIDNSNETYTDLFALNDKLRIYLDYATTATTLRFEGIIERISRKMNTVELTGRGSASIVTGTLVTYTASATEASVILIALIDKYFPGVITKTNITASSTNVTVNWYQKSFWECVIELCNASSFEAYIDQTYDMHFFASGTTTNATDMVVHEYNLLETGDFAPDLTVLKNKITVYGAATDGLPMIATAEDTDSQTAYGLKEENISDSNITTMVQAQNRANFELAIKKDPPTIGDITSLGLTTLVPGEKLMVSDPMNGLVPGAYLIKKFTHKFSNDEPFKTTITIYKEISSIPSVLKKRLSFEQAISTNDNPYEMEYSNIWDFNSDSGTHDSTVISGGFLLTDGAASGNWISAGIALDFTPTYVEVRATGTALEGTTYSVSADNGINFQVLLPNTQLTLAPPGEPLKVKVSLNSASTQIDTLCLLYK